MRLEAVMLWTLRMDLRTWVYNSVLKNKKRKLLNKLLRSKLLTILPKWLEVTQISSKEKMLNIFKLLCFNYWIIHNREIVKLQKDRKKQTKKSVKELELWQILEERKKEGNEEEKERCVILYKETRDHKLLKLKRLIRKPLCRGICFFKINKKQLELMKIIMKHKPKNLVVFKCSTLENLSLDQDNLQLLLHTANIRKVTTNQIKICKICLQIKWDNLEENLSLQWWEKNQNLKHLKWLNQNLIHLRRFNLNLKSYWLLKKKKRNC